MALEEGLLFKNHARHHAARAPYIERILVQGIVNEQLRALVVARGDSHVVGLLWEVELGESPVDESELPIFVVNYNIVGLYISVHNSLRMAKVKCLQRFVKVEANIEVFEGREQLLVVLRVDVFKDESWSAAGFVSHHIQQLHYIGPTR